MYSKLISNSYDPTRLPMPTQGLGVSGSAVRHAPGPRVQTSTSWSQRPSETKPNVRQRPPAPRSAAPRVILRPSIRFQAWRASCDTHASTEHKPCIQLASQVRLLIAALTRRGVLRPSMVARRVADAMDAGNGRPSGRGTPSSMAILLFAKQAFRVKMLPKSEKTSK